MLSTRDSMTEITTGEHDAISLTRKKASHMESTLEMLPNEILMVIFSYAGDVSVQLRTFLGLNQRLNRVVTDQCLHLLTYFLRTIGSHDNYQCDVYQSFSHACHSMKTAVDEEGVFRLLQPLSAFHLQNRFAQLGHDVQSSLGKLRSCRQQWTHAELSLADSELSEHFPARSVYSITTESIKQMENLVWTRGASLRCDPYELGQFNLTKAVNECLLSRLDVNTPRCWVDIDSVMQLFRTLILSNPSLLQNRDYVGNGGLPMPFFLIYSVYRLKSFYASSTSGFVSMKYYRMTVDLLLFAIQCQRLSANDDKWIEKGLFEALSAISVIHGDVFIASSQWEILKILTEQYAASARASWSVEMNLNLRGALKPSIDHRRLDVLVYLHSHLPIVRQFFDEPTNLPTTINTMSSSLAGRHFLSKLISESLLSHLSVGKDLLFILLQKRERQLLIQLLKLSPHLIDQLDADGNDALLYTCLKVRGCRHCIVEWLIELGSCHERRNVHGEHFLGSLRLTRNRTLLQRLIERGTCHIDPTTTDILVQET